MIAINYMNDPEKKGPSYMQNFMQQRMARQAYTSLNKANIKQMLNQEMAKQRVQ